MQITGLTGFKKLIGGYRWWMSCSISLSLFLMLGCASIRPTADPDFPDQDYEGNSSAFLPGNQEGMPDDSVNMSQNLALAMRHFHLAEQAIGDNDPERVSDELDQTMDYLSIADQSADSANYYDLAKICAEILESYRDFLRQAGTLPDEFVPEGVLLGDEEFYDSLQQWSDWYEDGVETPDTSLASVETIDIFPPIPLVTNRKVNQVVNYYRGKGHKVFLRWMDRAQIMLPRIQQILKDEGVPEELAYLAMIESGLNPKAYSWAHASGVWQFIRSTGRLFGLYSDWWYDERCDIDKSTRAAAEYLKKLYLEFDDWYLALAAYNCGEIRVHRAIRQHGSRNFWKLWRLPRQTENYVPSFLAAAIIMQNPTEYGFPEFQPEDDPSVDVVWVNGCVDLEVLANCAGTDVTTLKQLNPHILRWCTPPTVDSVAVSIPGGSSGLFQTKYAQIPQDKKTKWVRHRIRSGETLSVIARMYGTTISAIMDVPENNLRNAHRIPVGKYLLIPAPPGGVTVSSPEEPASYTDVSDSYEDQTHVTYRVRSGDTLGKIAARFGVSVQNLRNWNNLDGKRYIYPGQVLEIWSAGSGPATVASNLDTESNSTHTVRRGDSLWSISQRYGVSISQIQAANNMRGRTKIKPGDILIIPSRRSGG
jgi:membrane-bound lytic murein transglycosylase D